MSRPRTMGLRHGPRTLPSLLAVCVLGAACDMGADVLPGDGPVLLSSEPADRATDVDRRQPLRLSFDRLLWPRSVSRQSVRLESGGLRELLSVRFDPVRSVIVAEQFHGRPLEPEVTYRLTVEGLVDLDGRAFAPSRTITFRTGAQATGGTGPDPVQYAQVAPILSECARGGCHAGADAPLGLDFSSADAVRRTAIGIPSRQLPAPTSVEGSDASLVLAGLPIIDVVGGSGRPARSYLVYKILGDAHALGAGMPPEGPLPRESLERLADWILGGAPTD